MHVKVHEDRIGVI